MLSFLGFLFGVICSYGASKHPNFFVVEETGNSFWLIGKELSCLPPKATLLVKDKNKLKVEKNEMGSTTFADVTSFKGEISKACGLDQFSIVEKIGGKLVLGEVSVSSIKYIVDEASDCVYTYPRLEVYFSDSENHQKSGALLVSKDLEVVQEGSSLFKRVEEWLLKEKKGNSFDYRYVKQVYQHRQNKAEVYFAVFTVAMSPTYDIYRFNGSKGAQKIQSPYAQPCGS